MLNHENLYFKTQRNLSCISKTCDHTQAFSRLACRKTRGKKVPSQPSWNTSLVLSSGEQALSLRPVPGAALSGARLLLRFIRRGLL